MTEKFCKLTHEMMRATHWVSRVTGEILPLTGDQKLIWTWMESRYQFFQSQGKGWFDNQDDIAQATGCSVSAVRRFIKLLTHHGYMKVERHKVRGFLHSNVYTIIEALDVLGASSSVGSSKPVSGSAEVMATELSQLVVAPSVIASQAVVEVVEPFLEYIP